MPQVDYDALAPTYDERYAAAQYHGIAAALHSLVRQARPTWTLEVGCGSGYWLASVSAEAPAGARLVGLDLSRGMLRQAQLKGATLSLVHGRASRLPFPAQTFDLLFCVHAVHHFQLPQEFLASASQVLRPGGVLAVIGMRPPASPGDWYLYQYFPGAFVLDIARYPAPEKLQGWMAEAGLAGARTQTVERIDRVLHGREVLSDPFLGKGATSQLALLSEEEYAAGLKRLEAALESNPAAVGAPQFSVHLRIDMVTAHKPQER